MAGLGKRCPWRTAPLERNDRHRSVDEYGSAAATHARSGGRDRDSAGTLAGDSELLSAQLGDPLMNVTPRRPYRLAPPADHGVPVHAGGRGDHVADSDGA